MAGSPKLWIDTVNPCALPCLPLGYRRAATSGLVWSGAMGLRIVARANWAAVVLAFVLCACGGPQAQTQATIDVPEVPLSDLMPAHGWAGTWRTTRGTLELVQDGAKVIGSFTFTVAGQEHTGIVIGTPKGNRLEFKWSLEKGTDKGQGRFVLAANGSKFSGTFGNDLSCTDAGKWSGLRNDETLFGY